MKVLIFATHPIQYQVPIFRGLAKEIDLTVVYMMQQTKEGQADAGFNVSFEWDIPLFEGYHHIFMNNLSRSPTTRAYKGIVLEQAELEKVFATYRPDKVLIQGWFPKGYLQVLDYCYRHGIHTICRGDSHLLMHKKPIKKLLKRLILPIMLKKFDTFLVVGKANKEFYRYYGVDEAKLREGFHCVDTPFFAEQFAKAEKPFSSRIRIGFVGKLIEKKCPMLLLEAINNSKYKLEIEVVVIGDGPLRRRMEEYSKQYGISIIFKGFLNQSKIVADGYAHIDVLVLPSKEYETWGLVVNEAMTGGIPSIVSDRVGCHFDLIEEGKTGYVFRSNDADDLRKKVDAFIEEKVEGKDFHSEEVKKKIARYSLDETVRKISETLNEGR